MESKIKEIENELIKTQINKKLDKKYTKKYILTGILIVLVPIICDCILLGNMSFKYYLPFFSGALFIEYIGINSSYFNYKVESLNENALKKEIEYLKNSIELEKSKLLELEKENNVKNEMKLEKINDHKAILNLKNKEKEIFNNGRMEKISSLKLLKEIFSKDEEEKTKTKGQKRK